MGAAEILFFPFLVLGGVVAVLVGLIVFAFWVWMLIDCIKRKFRNDVEKIIWVLIIIFASWIGAIIYLITIRMYNPKGIAGK